jgi:tungstate transport system ATP-binding protein
MPERRPTLREAGGATILPLALERVFLRAPTGERWLVEDVSGELRPGTRTVLLGPNGAGKTLTLRLCHGLAAPSHGAVRWLGPGAGADPARRQAMVFQRPVLLRRSVASNVGWPLGLRGVPRPERRARVAAALAATGLAERAHHAARRLSVGEQQRVALARAWALQPEVLFLDEPSAALDPGATAAVETLVRAIAAEGTKVVLTTHDLAQARRLADEVWFLHRGRLLEITDAAEFFERPRSEEARAFLKGDLLW